MLDNYRGARDQSWLLMFPNAHFELAPGLPGFPPELDHARLAWFDRWLAGRAHAPRPASKVTSWEMPRDGGGRRQLPDLPYRPAGVAPHLPGTGALARDLVPPPGCACRSPVATSTASNRTLHRERSLCWWVTDAPPSRCPPSPPDSQWSHTMEDLMTTVSTANTASEMVRSATSAALRVAARELELYDTGDVAGADEVFAPDLIDHNPAGD